MRDAESGLPEHIERVAFKALYYFIESISPKGIAVIDEVTGNKYCIFMEEEGGQMIIDKSDTVEHDLELCDIVREENIH